MTQYVFTFILGGALLGPLVRFVIWDGIPLGAAGLLGAVAAVALALYVNYRQDGHF